MTLALKLPRLTTAVDCEPIGYPGLKVHFWLNVTFDPDRVDDEELVERLRADDPEGTEGKKDYEVLEGHRQPWERDYYYGLGRIVDRVEIPGEFTEDGEPVDVKLGNSRALYDLMRTPGFEQGIIVWASTKYYTLRQKRLEAEVKN